MVKLLRQNLDVLNAGGLRSLNAGLAVYWKMDESAWSGSSGEVIDSSGSGADGTAVNGANTVSSPAKFGRAGAFVKASSQYVDLGSPTALSISSQISVAAWLYPTSTGTILNAGYSWRVQISIGNYPSLIDNAAAAITATTPLTLGVWSHVVWVGSPSGCAIYINGSLTDSNTTAFTGGSAGSCYIGRLGSVYYDGYIDDLRAYARALSASEVSRLYNLVP